MRAAAIALVVSISLAGCVTELLGSQSVTTRTVTCAILGDESMRIQVHHDGEIPIREAVESWVDEMLPMMERTQIGFKENAAPESLEGWYESLTILDRRVTIHVAVVELDGAVQVVGPGAIAISNDLPNLNTTTAALFHGLGHVMGLVNQGTPHNSTMPTELPAGHAPGTVMDVGWHQAPYPETETDRYSEALRQDLQHTAQEVCL